MSQTPVATPVRPDNLGPEFVWCRVAIDGESSHPEGIFWAWVDPTNLWNGFAQPVFDLETAHDVTAWCGRAAAAGDDGPGFVWCSDGETLVEVHRTYPDEAVEHLVTVYRGPTYGIGDGWCWQFVDKLPSLQARIDQVVSEQGWNEQSMATLATGWIINNRHGAEFLSFLLRRAEDEKHHG